MSNVLELSGFLEEHGTQRPLSLVILEPEKTAFAEDYLCRIRSKELFQREIKLYGVDKAQATELAIRFLNTALEGKGLVDAEGQPIVL